MHRNLKWLDRGALAALTGRSFPELTRIARDADRLYAKVDKPTRGKVRKLSVPTKQLKAVQTMIYRHALRRLEFHPDVYCVPGRGALAAAEKHLGHSAILNLDIADFFPSVTADAVRRGCLAMGVPADVVLTLTRLLTFENQLPQGAATSVAVGNLVLLRLDVSISTLCRRHGFTYTRYVDDIVISGGDRLAKFERKIRQIVADCGWTLNAKGGLLGTGQRRRVLGLIVNAEANVDRAYYRDLQLMLKLAAKNPLLLSERQWRQLGGRVHWVGYVNRRRGTRLTAMLQHALDAKNLAARAGAVELGAHVPWSFPLAAAPGLSEAGPPN